MKAKTIILISLVVCLAAIGICADGWWQKQYEPVEFDSALGLGNIEKISRLIRQDPQLVNQNTWFSLPPLAHAAQQGQYEVAKLLLNNHADINAPVRSQWGKTALHFAAQRSDVKMVELLLDHGADVNARDDNRFTPMMDAIRSVEVMKLLLAHGADLNAFDHEGSNTTFSQVIENPTVADAGALQFLLDNGVDVTVSGSRCLEELALRPGDTDEMRLLVPYYVNFKNHAARSILESVLGETMDNDRPKMAAAMISSCLSLETVPLLKAVTTGNDAAVRSLLAAHPASVNEPDEFGWTPLHLAAMSDQPTVMETLLSNQAMIDAQDKLGNTALCWAAYLGHDKAAEVLLKHKATMDLVGGSLRSPLTSDWNTPLDFAIQQGFTSIALKLIGSGANIDTTNGSAATPLHFAAITGNAEVIASLLAHGAKIDARISSENQTPLDYAVAGDSSKSVRLLIAGGANLQTATYAADGGNLFHLWAGKAWNSQGNPAIADQLLAAGCDLNGKDSQGKTPLDAAIISQLKQAIQWLLDHQADINVKDKDGLTPLHYAAQTCNKESVQLLLDHHADVNATDNKGRTPLALLHEPLAFIGKGPSGGGPSPPASYADMVKLLQAYGAK